MKVQLSSEIVIKIEPQAMGQHSQISAGKPHIHI